MRQAIIFLFFLLICVFPAGMESMAGSTTSTQKKDSHLLNRIDFGNSYIMGQSIKSGAVYLLQRKKSEIKSMLEYRTDYRGEILEEFSVKQPEDVNNATKQNRTKQNRK